MFGLSYLSVTTLAALAAAAAGAALPRGGARSLDLSEMINNTVCAIEVMIDEDPERIPQRIKMMKCAHQTDHWCVENQIPHRDCCHHAHNRHVMECVEMTDTVVVFNKLKQATDTLDVSVGCACMIGRSTEAPALPGPT